MPFCSIFPLMKMLIYFSIFALLSLNRILFWIKENNFKKIIKVTISLRNAYDTVLDKPGQLAVKKPKIQKLAIQKLFILVSTYGI